MSKPAEHSPLPWKRSRPWRCIVVDANGDYVAETSRNHAPADRDFIVHACNNFGPLLEACEEARTLLKNKKPIGAEIRLIKAIEAIKAAESAT